ncbi:hypothetical protein U9M48_031563 [Paspalum notatum var. saurae]|uniref:Integrase catalytic domain-containing protein n=1 Tax=Paspalum notatum var. saurae TaxID=547442 RepID=A0AAQ3X3V7_PASNO
MTGHRKWFSSLNPMSTEEYMTFEDNVGSVSLSAKLSLREVAFVRNLGFNLVFVSQLLDEGFEVRFKKGACCVLDAEETLVCSLLPFGQVFRVDLTSISGPARCLVASPSADIWKWHRRLHHLSFDLLVRLSSMGLIRGFSKLKAEKDLVCHPCPHGKVVAASHTPVSQVMTSYPGELLHMDTVGPARVASVSGKWYVLVVVDGFSRFSWVFFMEFKDEAFGFVRDLVLRLRNESHKSMRAIRRDNGGEFRNSRFENFCRDLGLEHQFSSPYTPPQNGIVECKNHTLVEMAQTILNEHRTPRRFWAEAVNTTCYIANRIFLRAFLGKTSYKLWFGRQLSVKHLRAFGYRCFVPKKAGHLDKFDSRCLDGILEAKQVVETCEVSFDETMPCTTPAFQLSSDDEEGTPSLKMRKQAQAKVSPAEDAGEVTSEIVLSRQDVSHALSDPNWVNDMHEELENFERNHVWDLVEPPPNCRPIRTKWVFKNKQGENGMVQMDVKSAFLNGFIKEELYSRGSDTLIVQIYVDDIIFGGSSHALVSSFAEQMSREFEMSLMGELQFFLGLQIKHGLEGTFVHQAKYTRDILKKFNMGDSKPMMTPMSTNTALDADEDGEAVDQKEF